MSPKQSAPAPGRRRRLSVAGRHVTSEEQLRQLFANRVERERRVAEALLVIVRYVAGMRGSTIQSAIATVVDFIVLQTSSMRPRGTRPRKRRAKPEAFENARGRAGGKP